MMTASGPQALGHLGEEMRKVCTQFMSTVMTSSSGIWPGQLLPRGSFWCSVNAQYCGMDVWLVWGGGCSFGQPSPPLQEKAFFSTEF